MKLTNILVIRLLSMMVATAMLGVMLGVGCASAQSPASTANEEAVPMPPPAETIEEEVPGVPGISDREILFGQSAAFTGPAGQMGNEMRVGIQAAFHEANEAGGIHDRELKLHALNDIYETDFAFANTQRLIEKDQVFALIGAVGTPTAKAASPVASAAGVPFIAPFTGAEFLRNPELNNVLNLRASYYQETEEMVARLTEDLGITRIAVLCQDDSFGETGIEGVRLALERRGLEPVASGHYPHGTTAAKTAALEITQANPEAVIIIGSHAPVAKTIQLVRGQANPVFMAVSFAGSNALVDALGEHGNGVYVTQVVPLPDDTSIPVVDRYQSALFAYEPNAEPGFVSLEGYLAGRLAIAALERCEADVTRECFLAAARKHSTLDIDGMELKYGPGDNQGSDAVFLTVIGTDGRYHQVDQMGGEY